MSTPEERARAGMLRTMGLDSKRPDAWNEYGYKEQLTFQDFFNLYTRHGIAKGVVDRIAEKVFQTAPWVIQGPKEDEKKPETPWELEFQTMAEDVDLWWNFKEAYGMRMVGAWSAMILVFGNDKGKLSEQVKSSAVLTDIIPVWRGQLLPSTQDAMGNVTSWNYTPSGFDATDLQKAPPATIHPSRIYIVGDYKRGRSMLEAGYNSFVDMEKIAGGSAEGTLKNAARQLHINYESDANPVKPNQPDDEVADSLNDQAKALNTRSDLVLATQGATVNPLVAAMPDPEKPFNVSLQACMASVRIASRIVVGSQTGERASVEDIRDFNERCQGDREGEVAREIRGFVRHLEQYKLIDPSGGRITIMWDDLAEPTRGDRAALALTMAQTNQANIATGEVIYSSESIQVAAGAKVEEIDLLPEDGGV